MNQFNPKNQIDARYLTSIEKGGKIGQGDVGKIHRYKFVFSKDKSEALHERNLVVKQIREIDYVDKLNEEEIEKEKQRTSKFIDRMLSIHQYCKKIGLPVPTTFRRFNDDSIVMTDLTEDNKYYVNSANNNPLTHFEEVENLELDNLLEQIFSIIKICVNNEINLNHDVLFFKWKNGSGKVQVILGDLDYVDRHINFGSKYQPDNTIGNVYVSIHYFLSKFVKTDSFEELIGYVKKRFDEKGYKYPF